MNVRTRQRKEELLRLVDLIERLTVEVEINTASSSSHDTPELLLTSGLDSVAAAYGLEIKERRFEYEDSCNTQRTAVLDGILLVQIVSDSEVG